MTKLSQKIALIESSRFGTDTFRDPRAQEKYTRRVEEFQRHASRHANRRVKRQERPAFDD